MNDVNVRIRDYIVRSFLFGDGARLGDETSFLESSILDSTGMLELINFIEQEFGITIDPSELVPDNLDSVQRVAEFVERKRRSGPPGNAA
jgi:acyl carrier protein